MLQADHSIHWLHKRIQTQYEKSRTVTDTHTFETGGTHNEGKIY